MTRSSTSASGRLTRVVRRRLQPAWRGEVPAALPRPYLLNVGCGEQVDPAWVNLDLLPTLPGVYRFDVRAPLPLADGTCRVVYCSHVLEHVDRETGRSLVRELHRVLESGGTLRLVVPDLETIARLYLESLDGAAQGDARAVARHEWMTIELIDQLVRSVPGGEMRRYLQRDPMPEPEFVAGRIGEGVRSAGAEERAARPSVLARSRVWRAIESFRHEQRGERHRWMYDRVSLSRLLEEVGFVDVRPVAADESRIAGFDAYRLDVDESGRVRKPDSLFVEATRAG